MTDSIGGKSQSQSTAWELITTLQQQLSHQSKQKVQNKVASDSNDCNLRNVISTLLTMFFSPASRHRHLVIQGWKTAH